MGSNMSEAKHTARPRRLAGPDWFGDSNIIAAALLLRAAPDMLAALKEAALQLEYLADKFQQTSTGVAVLSRIKAAIAKAEGSAIPSADQGQP